MTTITLKKDEPDYLQKCNAIRRIVFLDMQKHGRTPDEYFYQHSIATIEKYDFGMIHCTEEEWNEAMKISLTKKES